MDVPKQGYLVGQKLANKIYGSLEEKKDPI